MATSYKIRLKRFNGTDYDTLNLISDNIIMNSGNNLQTDFNDLDSAIDDIVYVGDSAPSDPDVKIWLDTDAIGTSIVSSVNGKTGVAVLDYEDVGAMAELELLWTNASPSSSFAGQTILLDLTNYDGVFIYFGSGISDSLDSYSSAMVLHNFGAKAIYPAMSSTNVAIYSREINVSASGVIFSDCTRSTQGSSSTTTSSAAMKPLHIFGIKGVITT